MADHSVREGYWRELRSYLKQAKAAETLTARDEAIDQAGACAEKLARTADPAVEERYSAWFICEALDEIGHDDWVHPL